MSDYILSNANRFYAAVESTYGQAALPEANNRFPGIRVEAQQVTEPSKRLDKTGSRTYRGTSLNARRQTAFQVQSYLSAWSGSGLPGYGALFQAGLGAAPSLCGSLTISSAQSQAELQTTLPHGLAVGSGISYLGEIRFVISAPDSVTVTLNAPFTSVLVAGATLSPTVTYKTATTLPSVTLYDYWDPVTTVSRIIVGAAVDALQISVAGNYHSFSFSGPAADLIVSNSFTPGEGGLTAYPVEPAPAEFEGWFVPGELGQVWLGSTSSQFFTLSSANIEVKNSVGLRAEDAGSNLPRAISAGRREVVSKVSLFAQDDAQTLSLCAAAKQRAPVSALIQMGQQQGQLMGIYLPQVIPDMPAYQDSHTRLQWEFTNNLSQGTADDEIYLAFA